MKALFQYDIKDGACELRDVPIPEIGADDVLIKVKAAGICGADIEFYRAKATNINPPVILGHEFCGVVDKVGKNVKTWKEGDRVVSDNTGFVCGRCYACSTGNYLLCPDRLGLGYGCDGGFAEYVKIPGAVLAVHSNALMPLPDSLSFEEGAILEPSANSYKAVIQEGESTAGNIVVVFGPGPIGLFAVALAKVAGASQIVLIGGSPNRLAFGQKLGATHCINYREAPANVAEAVETVIGKNTADIIIDAAGSPGVMADAMRLIRPMGKIVKMAWTGPEAIDLNHLMFKGADVRGHFGYDSQSWRNILRLAGNSAIDYRSFISKTYKLDDWLTAFHEVEEKRHIKAVFSEF